MRKDLMRTVESLLEIGKSAFWLSATVLTLKDTLFFYRLNNDDLYVPGILLMGATGYYLLNSVFNFYIKSYLDR